MQVHHEQKKFDGILFKLTQNILYFVRSVMFSEKMIAKT